MMLNLMSNLLVSASLDCQKRVTILMLLILIKEHLGGAVIPLEGVFMDFFCVF